MIGYMVGMVTCSAVMLAVIALIGLVADRVIPSEETMGRGQRIGYLGYSLCFSPGRDKLSFGMHC
jgi:hypothetical protein